MSQARLAFDIETVSPTVPHDERPDFDDPEEFELLAVGLGYQESVGADIETEVLFREGWNSAAECQLISDVAAWITDHVGDQSASLLTYNGDGFDIPITNGRAEIAGTEVGDQTHAEEFKDALSAVDLVDIKPDAWDAFGEYTRLETVCDHCNCSPPETRLDDYDCGIEPSEVGLFPDDQVIENSHVPRLGEYYLDWADDDRQDSEFEALRQLLYDYTVADIEPLYELDNKRPFKDVTAV